MGFSNNYEISMLRVDDQLIYIIKFVPSLSVAAVAIVTNISV